MTVNKKKTAPLLCSLFMGAALLGIPAAATPNPTSAPEPAAAAYNADDIVNLITGTSKALMFLSFGIAAILLVRNAGRMMNRVASVEKKMAGNFKSESQKGSQKKVTFKDVAGNEEAKESLQDIVEFLKNPAKFAKLGGKMPKGTLMLGSPGTGKTLLARAVAGEANVPFFSISGSEFVEMFVGVGAARVRELFATAKRNAPCIIFIDELDAVGRARGTGKSGPDSEREQTLNQLLTEIDGFEENSGVFVMGATNRPEVLDPALTRPGRLTRKVSVDKPHEKAREQILSLYIQKIPTDGSADIGMLAKASAGFSGAQLANIVNEAAIEAAKVNKKLVTHDDLVKALEDEALGGKERKSVVQSPEKRERTAIHEAGHAVRILADGLNKIMKATVVPREKSLGHVWSIPVKDEESVSTLLSHIESSLAGRAAEEIFYDGDVGPGAGGGEGSDIDTVTDMVHRMVREFGMSDMGPISFANTKSTPLGQLSFSQATAAEIDEVEKKMIREAYKNTLDFIREHRDEVDKVARGLLQHGTLSGNQIETLLGKMPVAESRPVMVLG